MPSLIKTIIINSFWYKKVKKLAQKTYLRDKKTSYYDLYIVIVNKAKRNELLTRADGVAFNFTMSVFPFIIFLFTLIPYIPVKDLDLQIMDFLAELLPSGIYKEAAPTIHDIVSKPRGNLLSLVVILALYSGTSGMMALMSAFNKMHKTIENRGFIRTRLTAIALTLILVSVMLIGILLIIVGQFVLDWLINVSKIETDWVYYAVNVLKYFVVFVVFFIGISLVYYIAPAIHNRWTFFSSGSVIASILAILVTQLFSFYINNFASYNRLYGSLGTFIALMVWFLLLAIILLLGFEINASIDEAKIEARMQNFKGDRNYHKIRLQGRDPKNYF